MEETERAIAETVGGIDVQVKLLQRCYLVRFEYS